MDTHEDVAESRTTIGQGSRLTIGLVTGIVAFMAGAIGASFVAGRAQGSLSEEIMDKARTEFVSSREYLASSEAAARRMSDINARLEQLVALAQEIPKIGAQVELLRDQVRGH